MLRGLFVASLALMLAGCATVPESTPAKAPITKHIKAALKQAAAVVAPVPDDKPKTFKQRWFDRFMKHKSK